MHLIRAWRVLERRGFGYIRYLITGVLIPKFIYFLLYRLPRQRMQLTVLFLGIGAVILIFIRLSLHYGVLMTSLILFLLSVLLLLARAGAQRLQILHMQRQAHILTKKVQSTYTQETFTSWRELPIELSVREAIESARRANPREELVIGQIDADGRLLDIFGKLPGFKAVSEANFLKRQRFFIDIVLIGDKVLLRKDFRKDREGFVREWFNLVTLYGKANVPAVYAVNEKHYWLYKNLILGQPLNHILANAGARILRSQTNNDPELLKLNQSARIQAVWERAKAFIPSVLSKDFLLSLEEELDKLHASGIAGLSLTYGNIIIDAKNNKPWFVDLEGAQVYHSTSNLAFVYRRDADRIKFNQIYGRNLITEESARSLLSAELRKLPNWYAPIDFGSGLTVGGFWSTDSGGGRWDFFNRHIVAPLIAGKRVLDLGSNNGVMSLLMLRAGAKEVVGVELSQTFTETAKVVKRIFEWRDMKKYSFCIHNRDIMEILNTNLGNFDVVTAFCSLYYLSAENMAKIVRKAAELAALIVIQAKTDTRKEARDNKAEKSSVTFLKRLLEENGFPWVEVFTHAPVPHQNKVRCGTVRGFAPPERNPEIKDATTVRQWSFTSANYNRPLLLGRKT